jgi:hypothetical protein
MIVESAFTGGESVYCINQLQMRRAVELANKDPLRGPRIQAMIREMELRLDRNERAAVAFLVLDRLLRNPAQPEQPTSASKGPDAARPGWA